MIKPDRIALGTLATLALLVLLVAVACSPATGDGPPNTPQVSTAAPTPGDGWSVLLSRTPYPYRMPLPPPTPTGLDGTYAKFELKETEPVHCLRCPDYAPEGGVWKLSLDRGVFRIYHAVTGWRSLGSFTVADDRLVLANDPNCPDDIGTYTWQRQEGQLILSEVDDPCAIRLRAMNLTNLPWLSCQPPNAEAGITDHWLKPRGCE